jgi:catecholate siderophore receptor
MAMGALVASASLSGRLATPAYAHEPLATTSTERLKALRFVVPAETVAFTAWLHQAPSPQDPPARRFDIAAGPLEDVLAAFTSATGMRITLASDTLRTVQSPGVSGLFTIEQAIEQLLAGTNVTYRFVAPQAIELRLAGTTETVEVTAGRIVSSPKYTEPLRDIPQTINVITKDVMTQQGATTLRDVLRNVPGITFQAGEGGVPAGDQLTIRGFSARTDLFVDGVRDFGGYTRDAFNLEQVEVAKGPSSAIAGRGSTGGSINQVSKLPSLQSGYLGTVSVGNAEYKRTTIDVNQPLSIGAIPGVAFRLNGMWTDNDVPRRTAVHADRWGVAPSIAVGLGTAKRATLSYLHLGQDNVPEYGLPWVPPNTNPELQAYSNGRPPVDQRNFYGLTTRDYEKTDTDIATLQLEFDASRAFTLRNTTRYGVNNRDSVITAPRFASVETSTAINRQLQSRDMDDSIVANYTNLVSRFETGAIRHAVSAGLEVAAETSENHGRSGPLAPQADLYHPNPSDPYTGPIVRNGAFTKGTANSAAVYAFDTVELGRRWELTGGLRWERFDLDFDSLLVTGEAAPFNRTDSVLTGRGAAVFKPKVNGSVYVSYATSFNPSAEGLSLNANTVNLEPERARIAEVGTKWDVGQRLSMTAAGFHVEKTNARTPGVNPGDPPTVLAGRQRVAGIELGISGRINDRWSALAGYSYMDSKIAASNTPAEIDNALALTPNNTFNLWTTFALPGDVTIGGGLQYMDAVFRNATNISRVPSYWLVNGLASYAVNEHLTLRLNGTNLANEEYVDRVGGGHYIPGPGRSVSVSTDIGF